VIGGELQVGEIFVSGNSASRASTLSRGSITGETHLQYALPQATELTYESNVYFFKLQFTLKAELGIAESTWRNNTIESTGMPDTSLHFEGSGQKPSVRPL
jgi:hypothetical protein